MKIAVVVACVVVALTAPAHAQQSQQPLPVMVLDVRGFYPGLGQDPLTADGLGVVSTQLPARGLGAVGGIHLYPIRGRSLALGIGGEGILARGKAQTKDQTGTTIGLPIRQQLLGLSGALSVNFGHRDGWSYLTAGIGPLAFGTYVGDTPPLNGAPTQMTLNLGGGARWFATRHVAFEFDIRFYQTRPEIARLGYPPRHRKQLLVLSAGIGLK